MVMAACEQRCNFCPFRSQYHAVREMEGQKVGNFALEVEEIHPVQHNGVELKRKGDKLNCSLTYNGRVAASDYGSIGL